MLKFFYKKINQVFENIHEFFQHLLSSALVIVSLVFSEASFFGILNEKILKNATVPFGVFFLCFLGLAYLGTRSLYHLHNRLAASIPDLKTENGSLVCLAENPVVKAHSRERVDQEFSKKYIAPLSPSYQQWLSVLCCLNGREQSVPKDKSVLPEHEMAQNRCCHSGQRHRD